MENDTEKNRQQGGQVGQQSGQTGQQGQKGQPGQTDQTSQKKGGQAEDESENLDRQRRAS
jgi:hypothetical protein